MANLLLRNVDDQLVQSLRQRAAARGRSAEAEHREILAKALSASQRKTFAEALMSIPNVGVEADFARIQGWDGGSVSGREQGHQGGSQAGPRGQGRD
ncbi:MULTISPECIES: FitA-like ribbon-helix-helix domain-containing protein [Paraburkholderia]|uniref:DNA-binding protein n=1 Tax=Paraburkholderia kirstenboschensis TaxID=1245436 RepID=A0ABZ0ERI3_9BURK|nr:MULTISPECIES: DNA-binding protein [Paraburkholderia]WOD18698.1 DNA-binding protein [Paraburkholderia kirstenboschensis]